MRKGERRGQHEAPDARAEVRVSVREPVQLAPIGQLVPVGTRSPATSSISRGGYDDAAERQ
jgi:hypothetical protein